MLVFDHAHRTLTPQEKADNRRISSLRVRIEHVIGDIKWYRIIREVIRSGCSEFRDKVMETCCGLHNFRIRLERKGYLKIKVNLDEVYWLHLCYEESGPTACVSRRPTRATLWSEMPSGIRLHQGLVVYYFHKN